MSSKFFAGADLLQGDNTIPGTSVPPELKVLLPKIFKSISDFGCTHYPTVVQMLTYDEISEVAAYGGFPSRYPHWRWGGEYEELQRGYEHGMHRIYEMVINTNPCYIYCLDSNTLCDNVTVVAHALGHADFFKNNIFFAPTSQNAMNQLANNGSRIRRIMQRWGKEFVGEFLDHVLKIETLIDPTKAWYPKTIKDRVIWDQKNYYEERRINVPAGKDYMEEWINPPEWRQQEAERIKQLEQEDFLNIFRASTSDIFGFLRDNAPLKPWQSDIMSMIYGEAQYFSPQRMTKMLNEGWASFIDMTIMCRKGLLDLCEPEKHGGVVDYAIHKMGVLGGKYSMNPYKLGFSLFMDIEDRWNKGRFGREWEQCEDIQKKEEWDTGANLGKEKIFEVRKYYNDVTALMEFFTRDFCEKNQFFEYEQFPNGDVKIVRGADDWQHIRNKLVKRYMNGGLPMIKLVDPNFKGRRYLLLEHTFTGEPLYTPYIAPVLRSIYHIWQNPVFLSTETEDGAEVVWVVNGPEEKNIMVLPRKDVEKGTF